MKKIILFSGNPLLPSDNKPYKLLPYLKKKFPHVAFLPFDPTEELPETYLHTLFILDTVHGLRHVKLFTSLEQFTPSPHNCVHDFDLYMQLKLLQKVGKIHTVNIIGIPQKEALSTIKKEVENLLITSGF